MTLGGLERYWTYAEVAAFLDLTVDYVSDLARRLAGDLAVPTYRRFGSHQRLYRVFASSDVQRLQAAILRRRVKWRPDPGATPPGRTSDRRSAPRR